MNRQRGAALLVLLGILAIGASWFLVSKLDALGASFAARDRNYNAAVLNRAKQALIGYVAAQAMKPMENNPGSLPCPENPGDFNDPLGLGYDGRTGSGCGNSLKVGRFPWRTIGTEKLVDASGEPLWYVVSTNWGVPTGGNTSINSSSVGQLTLDGVPNAAIALIIAPGPALAVPAAAGCTAWNQARPVVGPPDWRNYLECDNANSPADVSFVTTGPAGSFNDQVMRVAVSDIMPALEAAIADRIQREIVPPLKDVFLGPNWGLPAGARVFPFAAPFGDPGPGAGTSNYAGAAGTYQGLLPFNQVECTADANNPRCLPGVALVSWFAATAYDGGGVGYIQTQSCWWETGASARVCEGEYHETVGNESGPGMRIEMQMTLNNVAMGLRAFDATRIQVEAKDDGAVTWISITPGYAMTMNPDGSLTIRFWGDLPNIDSMGWGSYANYRIRIERLVASDHALLDSTNAVTGWFVRNEWFRLLYYAAAQTHTAANLPSAPSCATGVNCLRLTSWPSTAPIWDKRALLILAGRALTGQARPSNLPTNYVEFQNGDGGTMYEQQPIRSVVNAALRAPFNDRVVVIDSN